MALILGDATLESLARRHLRMGRLREAQELVEDWVTSQPESLHARVLQGWLLLQGGRFDDGRQLIETAMSASPNLAFGYVALGALHSAQDKNEEALLCWQRALVLDPGDTEAATLLAQTHMRLGDVSAAENVARSALLARPKEAIAHFTLSEVLLAKGQLDEAIQLCTRGVALEPDDWRGWTVYSRVLARAGRPVEARAHLERALLLRPGELQVMHELAALYLQQGLWSEVQHMAKKMLALNPKLSAAHRMLAAALAEQLGFEQAIASLTKALAAVPGDAALLLDLAAFYKRAGKLEEARSLAHQAQSAVPGLPEAEFFLAELALLEGDVAQAFEKLSAQEKARPSKHERLPADLASVPGRQVVLSCDSIVQTMLLARYAHVLAQHQLQVSIVCAQPTLWGALASCFKDVQAILGLDAPLASDVLIEPLSSLPARAGVSAQTSQAALWQGEYLHVQAEHVAQVQQFLADQPKPWVGIELSSNQDAAFVQSVVDAVRRSGGTAVALGPGLSQELLDGFGVWPPVDDLYALAVWTQALDTVVVAAGLVPSLAGAMGKCAHVLLDLKADALWGLHAQSTPWYPSLRLYRQSTEMGWQGVWPALTSALEKTCS